MTGSFDSIMDELRRVCGAIRAVEVNMPHFVPRKQRTYMQNKNHKEGLKRLQGLRQKMLQLCLKLEQIMLRDPGRGRHLSVLQALQRKERLVFFNGTDPLTLLIRKMKVSNNQQAA